MKVKLSIDVFSSAVKNKQAIPALHLFGRTTRCYIEMGKEARDEKRQNIQREPQETEKEAGKTRET